MDDVLRILNLEDEEEAVQVTQAVIEGEVGPCRITRVDDLPALREQLGDPAYRLMITDFSVPGIDTLATIEMARSRRPDLPLIVVTGTVGEESAVECLRRGAVDFVLKTNLRRLPAAVRRALAEAEEQRARQAAESEVQMLNHELALRNEELRLSAEQLSLAMEATCEGLFDCDLETNTCEFSVRYFAMLGYGPQELPESHETFRFLLHPDDWPRVEAILGQYRAGAIDQHAVELRFKDKSGNWRWILSRARMVQRTSDGSPKRLVGTHLDITERKHVEWENQRQLEELRSWQMVMLNREDRILELKREVNRLCRKCGEPLKFHSLEDGD